MSKQLGKGGAPLANEWLKGAGGLPALRSSQVLVVQLKENSK